MVSENAEKLGFRRRRRGDWPAGRWAAGCGRPAKEGKGKKKRGEREKRREEKGEREGRGKEGEQGKKKRKGKGLEQIPFLFCCLAGHSLMSTGRPAGQRKMKKLFHFFQLL